MNSASIFDLSPSEKLQLVEDLWDDLAAASEAVPVHDWQKQELAPRKAHLLKNPASYEGRRAGLGEEFLSSVDACLESIRRRPEMYPVVHEGYRRSLIRRFPYAVFYELSEATVTIYAVFHTSRDPDKWRQRLP